VQCGNELVLEGFMFIRD